MTNTFRTDDGYILYRIGGEWLDNEVWTDADLSFDMDYDGHPIDDNGELLEGEYV